MSALLNEVNNHVLKNFFLDNVKNLKNTYKGIKDISLKCPNCSSPNSVIDNNATLTDPTAIVNAFNRYFSTIALDIQSSIRYSKKLQFFDALLQ